MMDAIKFLKLWDRLCRKNSCIQCPLSSFNNQVDIVCKEFLKKFPEKAVEIVEAWAKEHPEKTYFQDLREKYPNALIHPISSNPAVCRRMLYGGNCPREKDNEKMECIDCWNEPMEV